MAGVIVAGSLIPTIGGSYVAVAVPEPPPIVLPKPLTIEERIAKELPPVFIKIAMAESGMRATAYNSEWHYDSRGNKVCQGSYGILQISCIHYGGDPTDLYDVGLNIKIARKVYETQGKMAWGVCRKINCSE